MRNVFSIHFFIFSLLLLPCSELYAKPQHRELLGSTGSVGYGDVSLPSQFDGDIQGGVSLTPKECRYEVTNTSPDTTYRISVELTAFLQAQKRGGSSSSSYQLKPGESENRTVKVKTGTVGCALWITRWRAEKKKLEEEADSEADSAEKQPDVVPENERGG